jgi:cobalt-zinc-cadmium efflux system outer membrane protein
MYRRCRLLLLLLALGSVQPLNGQESYSLEDLLRMGRENSPLVLALRAEHSALDAARRHAGRWENPELAFDWGTGTPFDGGADRSLSGFTVMQELENPFTRHYRMGAFQARVESKAEDVKAGILDVEYEIRLHFYRVLYLMELVELASLNEEALSEIRALIETRAALGEVRELEAIRLRVEHLRARNELEAAKMQLDQNRSHLNTLLGKALPEGYRLEGTLAVNATEPDLARLTQEVLPTHPALQKAGIEREVATQELRESQTGWVPNPVLSGSSRTEMDGDVLSFGIGFKLPLWNQSRAATLRARETLNLTEYREEATRLELEAQLMIHHNHLRLIRQTLSLFEEGLLAEAEESMVITEVSYRAGEVSFMEYLDARRTYHSILNQRQQALYDWNVESAALDRAAGGSTR